MNTTVTVLLLVLIVLVLALGVAGAMAARRLAARLREVRSELRQVATTTQHVATTTGSTRPMVERLEERTRAVERRVHDLQDDAQERRDADRDAAWLRSAWHASSTDVTAVESEEERRARVSDPHRVRVAAILDEFSFNAFEPECELIELLPDTWRETMERTRPDLFLCESAWSGRDPVAHPWQGRIYTRATRRPRDRRAELLAILDYCRLHGIPTVFWNKEDPIHSEDPERNFVRTALEFDHILTTDAGCLPMYAALGRPDAGVLQFAYQPAMFRPPTPDELAEHPREPVVVLAGGWYEDHPERCAAMAPILDSIIASPYELVIYDRFSDADDPLHVFPEKYQPYCRPAVPQSELARIYRRAMFGLTINTVTDSPTMYARRAHELLASGCVVLSNYSLGLDRDFGDVVVFLDREPEALSAMTPGEWDRRSAQGQLEVREATAGARFREVLARVEI